MAQEHLEHLGNVLRDFRTRHEISGRKLAALVGISQSTISKLESGLLSPTDEIIDKICAALNLTKESRMRLVIWQKLLSQPFAPYVPIEKDTVAQVQRAINEFEVGTSVFRIYQLLYIPGLLQTESYARKIISGTFQHYPAQLNRDLKAAVKERLKRQEILDDSSKRFTFLIHESAIKKIPDRSIRDSQIKALIDWQSRANITIGLIPSSQQWFGELTVTSFDILDRELVLVDTYRGILYLWMESVISAYLSLFEKIHVNCVFGDQLNRELSRIQSQR